MNLSRITRPIGLLLISGALVVGLGVAPASATPAGEAVYLSALKSQWNGFSDANQATTCKGYKALPAYVIRESVAELWKNAASRKALSKPAWKRVITKYLAWACSGPATTPR